MLIQLPLEDHKIRRQNPKHSIQSRKRVRFSCFVIQLPTSTMVKEERNKVWYKSSEIDAFKEDAKMLSRAFRCQKSRSICGNLYPSKFICSRGLEKHICDERRKIKRIVIRQVLKAQKQARFSKNNIEKYRLSKFYSILSAPAKQQAFIDGISDYISSHK